MVHVYCWEVIYKSNIIEGVKGWKIEKEMKNLEMIFLKMFM